MRMCDSVVFNSNFPLRTEAHIQYIFNLIYIYIYIYQIYYYRSL